ncbi:hypothetical protein CRG98_011197 [Punica granatum]|uniref:RNase H type-1 domain-containing protein n=1 Tax=Punica granatum TaxID=22663 RepID=A0A2I0KJA1_PUNGR|nr:hypothetical protein CRG98_011197 [Punica granatum]
MDPWTVMGHFLPIKEWVPKLTVWRRRRVAGNRAMESWWVCRWEVWLARREGRVLPRWLLDAGGVGASRWAADNSSKDPFGPWMLVSRGRGKRRNIPVTGCSSSWPKKSRRLRPLLRSCGLPFLVWNMLGVRIEADHCGVRIRLLLVTGQGGWRGEPLTSSLVRNIRTLLAREWVFEVVHTHCEGNGCADWMARWATALPSGLQFYSSLLGVLALLLMGDCIRVSMPRFCTA